MRGHIVVRLWPRKLRPLSPSPEINICWMSLKRPANNWFKWKRTSQPVTYQQDLHKVNLSGVRSVFQLDGFPLLPFNVPKQAQVRQFSPDRWGRGSWVLWALLQAQFASDRNWLLLRDEPAGLWWLRPCLQGTLSYTRLIQYPNMFKQLMMWSFHASISIRLLNSHCFCFIS